MDRPPATRTRLYDQVQLDEVIADMARRAAGFFPGPEPIAVIGILRRGAPLAGRITELLVSRHGMPPPSRLDLRVARYADDLTLLHPETLLFENPADAGQMARLAGRRLLVVDDVLYAGNSLLRAVDHLARHGAGEIRVAVLVDRNVARLPVRADIVGIRLQVAPPDIVECYVPPYEPEFGVELVRA
jgi:pyrimidine operon attenuation protein/uracil phosphoribosyltransferase